ncbi:MAG: hypothetical protein OIF50_08025, partial [Flavobacteriaceae bacterium]|nr:hypothetical protein [Flavobacteriaceae bacterium]
MGILDEKNYYPFGLQHRGYNFANSPLGNATAKKFGYNGIELEEGLGVDLYEMNFRQYDPTLGRFTSIDPVVHHSLSTYNAFDNNPVYWADPSGADSKKVQKKDLGLDELTPLGNETSFRSSWWDRYKESKSNSDNFWYNPIKPIANTNSGGCPEGWDCYNDTNENSEGLVLDEAVVTG